MDPWKYEKSNEFYLVCSILQALMNLQEKQISPTAKELIDKMIDLAIDLLKFVKSI